MDENELTLMRHEMDGGINRKYHHHESSSNGTVRNNNVFSIIPII